MMSLVAKALLWIAALVVTIANILDVRAAEPRPPEAALDQVQALRASQAAIGRLVGAHRLVDREGRAFDLTTLRGKPLVVNFVYTGCYQVCPTTTKFLADAIKEARRALGDQSFRVLTIGFNLPFDHPAAMKAYARRLGIDVPGWEFASPDAAAVDDLVREFGFSYAQTPNGFDHILQVTIVDAEGRIYRQLYGDAFALPLLVGPLKELITGTPTPTASLGDWIERVKLLCTVYDPAAGRYRVNYAVVIEIFVGASILIAGIASLAYEWRKRRHARPAA